jgi:hypothetical protein
MQSAKDALAQQYGGETSPLDGAPFAEHTFVIPDVLGRFDRIVSPSSLSLAERHKRQSLTNTPRQRDQMAHLGLVPGDMTPSSLLNVFPRLCFSYSLARARLTESLVATHRHFEGHYMTFYPSIDVLRRCIDTESRQLLHREQETACGRVDPGRLRYSSTYASLPATTPFDVFFDIEYGSDTLVNYRNHSVHATYRTPSNQYLSPIPFIYLTVSPAIMVWMRTSVLAGIHPRTPKIEVIGLSYIFLIKPDTPIHPFRNHWNWGCTSCASGSLPLKHSATSRGQSH